jgi:DHA1 family bicyclomycin/chloramphenicol resistance-like MFS transporter
MTEPPPTPASRLPALWALVLVTGVGPLATDSYVAALPELRRSLETTAAVAQLTLTGFIVGIALGQLALGPVSDGRGRRGLLLVCASVFAVSSLACALAPTGPVLVLVRVVQGVVAGGGVAIGRAVVSDRYEGAAAAARYGTLASITFLGPVVAPALGGLVLTVGTWRTVFACLAVVGAVMVVAVVVGIPETLPPDRRHPGGLAHTLGRVGDLLGDAGFTRHVVVQCLATAGFFTYIGGSSFVLETAYGIGQSAYALLFATNAAAMAVTSALFRLLVHRAGSPLLRTIGVLTSTTAAAALLLVALVDRDASWPVAVPWALLCAVVGGMGLSIPATTALAQQAGRRAGGTAAALTGGLTFLVGASVTPLTGILGYDSLLPMALLMTGFFVASTACLVASGSTRR